RQRRSFKLSHSRASFLVFPGGTSPGQVTDLRTRARFGLFRYGRLDSLGPCRELELDLPLVIQDESRAKRFAVPGTKARQDFPGPTLLEQLPGDLGRERARGDPLPDHKPAPGLLSALPARAAVGARVLADRQAAARARADLDALRTQLLLVERGDLLDGRAREALDLAHELRAVAAAMLDVGEPLLPVAGELGRCQRMRLEHRDHLDPLRRRLEVLAEPLDVLAADQGLDRLGARRRRAEAAILHR